MTKYDATLPVLSFCIRWLVGLFGGVCEARSMACLSVCMTVKSLQLPRLSVASLSSVLSGARGKMVVTVLADCMELC